MLLDDPLRNVFSVLCPIHRSRFVSPTHHRHLPLELRTLGRAAFVRLVHVVILRLCDRQTELTSDDINTFISYLFSFSFHFCDTVLLLMATGFTDGGM